MRWAVQSMACPMFIERDENANLEAENAHLRPLATSGRGADSALLDRPEPWARAKDVHRLELTVDAETRRAIALYEKFGFAREGVKRQSRKVNGRYRVTSSTW